MPKFTISKRQLKVILRKASLARDYGNFEVMMRCQALQLLFVQQLSLSEIGIVVQRSTECVRTWVIAFAEKGVKSLKLRSPIGRQPKMNKAQCKELAEMLDRKPTEL
jgi:transposase